MSSVSPWAHISGTSVSSLKVPRRKICWFSANIFSLMTWNILQQHRHSFKSVSLTCRFRFGLGKVCSDKFLVSLTGKGLALKRASEIFLMKVTQNCTVTWRSRLLMSNFLLLFTYMITLHHSLTYCITYPRIFRLLKSGGHTVSCRMTWRLICA